MFEYSKEPLVDKIGVSIGWIINLKGKLVIGSSKEEYKKADELSNEIKKLSRSEVILLNLTELEQLHSTGIKIIIPDILKINNETTKRKPVSLLGNRKGDVFDAIHVKHREIGTDVLPWYDSVEDFKKNF